MNVLRRRSWLAAAVTVALFCAVAVAGCGGRAASGKATVVRVGTLKALSDAPIYIAMQRGYFRRQGLDVQNVNFDSGANMIAPLSSGQLEVGAGSPSAGLYNAMASGLKMSIVADKGHLAKDADYVAVLARKALKNKLHSWKDLKGRRIGLVSTSNSSYVQLSNALTAGGLSASDVRIEQMDFPSMGPALANGSIDVAFAPEPFVTQFVSKSLAYRWRGVNSVVPGQQAAVLMYNVDFATSDKATAKKFMVAYLKGVRDYNDAFFGKKTEKNFDEVAKILTKYTTIKDASVLKKMVPAAVNADGSVNEKSLRSDYDFYRSHHLLKGSVDLGKAIDMSFAEQAAKTLGP